MNFEMASVVVAAMRPEVVVAAELETSSGLNLLTLSELQHFGHVAVVMRCSERHEAAMSSGQQCVSLIH